LGAPSSRRANFAITIGHGWEGDSKRMGEGIRLVFEKNWAGSITFLKVEVTVLRFSTWIVSRSRRATDWPPSVTTIGISLESLK
jgi:hypothetical protein